MTLYLGMFSGLSSKDSAIKPKPAPYPTSREPHGGLGVRVLGLRAFGLEDFSGLGFRAPFGLPCGFCGGQKPYTNHCTMQACIRQCLSI